MKSKLCLCLLLPVLLTGCYDNREMEDRDYVITMGIDKNDGSDGSSRYTVSLGSANLSAMGNKEEPSGGSEESKTSAVVVPGDSLSSAIRRADTYSSTQIYLGQLKTVVFGQALLEDQALFTSVLDELERNRDVSEKIILLGAEGKAADYVEAILGKNDTTGLFIWNFYKNTAQDVAVTQAVHLEEFLRGLRDTNGQGILPRINLEQDKLRLGGGMAIANYSYIAPLRDAEQRGYLLMKGQGKGAVLEEKWEDTIIPLWLYKNESKIWFTEEAEQLVCHIQVKGDGSIEGSNLLTDRVYDERTIKTLENLFENNIKTEIENTIKIAQQEHGKDIFQLGPMLKRKQPSLYHKFWRQEDSLPSDMAFAVQADVNIRTVGVIE